MKSFNNKNIKESIKGIYQTFKDDNSNQENVEILKNISEDIVNENYENFEAYNKILEYDLFDEEYYLKQISSSIKIDPLLHYIYYGYKMDLNPSKTFDSRYYREFNNINEKKNPLVYLVNQGINEGKIKVNNEIWQPPAINKYEINEKIKNMNEYGLNITERNVPIIISFTSYPKRIHEVKYTLYSLLNQEVKPDKIVLWLSQKEFPNKEKDLPKDLINFLKYGLIIRWCDSKKSSKKLIPSFKEYSNALLVTADDDLYYPENWLKLLYEHHKKYPKDIVSHRSRKIIFDDGKIKKYLDWEVLRNEEDASFCNFFTTGSGVLFPPHCLSDIIFNNETYERLGLTSDDLWFWTAALLNDSKIRVVNNCIWELTYVNPARDLLFKKDTLWSYNETHNDEQIAKILEAFPILYEKLSE